MHCKMRSMDDDGAVVGQNKRVRVTQLNLPHALILARNLQHVYDYRIESETCEKVSTCKQYLEAKPYNNIYRQMVPNERKRKIPAHTDRTRKKGKRGENGKKSRECFAFHSSAVVIIILYVVLPHDMIFFSSYASLFYRRLS